MNDKKGQLQHVFIFILFLIIAGFLMGLGFKAIQGFNQDACEIGKLDFKSDLESYFDIYDDYGSLHREEMTLPCDYQYVCFVDSSVYNPTVSTSFTYDEFLGDPGKRNVIDTARTTKFNIFLVGRFAEPLGYSEKISVENAELGSDFVTCIKSQGSGIKLIFEGKGRKTLVKEQ